MSHRNFWRMQLHWGEDTEAPTNECLEQHLIGLDFAVEIKKTLGDLRNKTRADLGEKSNYYDFYEKMDIGDIVLITRGPTPHALVEVVGEYKFSSASPVWCQHYRKVRILGNYKTDKSALPSPSFAGQGAIQRINRDPEKPVYNFVCCWLALAY